MQGNPKRAFKMRKPDMIPLASRRSPIVGECPVKIHRHRFWVEEHTAWRQTEDLGPTHTLTPASSNGPWWTTGAAKSHRQYKQNLVFNIISASWGHGIKGRNLEQIKASGKLSPSAGPKTHETSYGKKPFWLPKWIILKPSWTEFLPPLYRETLPSTETPFLFHLFILKISS